MKVECIYAGLPEKMTQKINEFLNKPIKVIDIKYVACSTTDDPRSGFGMELMAFVHYEELEK